MRRNCSAQISARLVNETGNGGGVLETLTLSQPLHDHDRFT
jgi:hypothetical protein